MTPADLATLAPNVAIFLLFVGFAVTTIYVKTKPGLRSPNIAITILTAMLAISGVTFLILAVTTKSAQPIHWPGSVGALGLILCAAFLFWNRSDFIRFFSKDMISELDSALTDEKVRRTLAESTLSALNVSLATIEFDLNGVILHANENYLNLMGYEADEIVGKHHSMFVEPSYATSEEYKNFWRQLAEGQYMSAAFKRISKGGNEIWIQATYNPVLNADGRPVKVIKFATDVTAERERFADYIGQIEAINRSQLVVEFDLNGNILNANENFLNLFGYTLKELQSRHHSLLVDENYKESEEYRNFWTTLKNGEFHSSEFRRIAKDGTEIWIQASYNPIRDLNGKHYKIVKVATDVSDRKRAEREIRIAKEAAEAGNRAKSAFLANMSHEIRTPMNGVIGTLDVLKKTDINPTQKSMIDTINRSARFLMKLINNLLDFSQSETGSIEVEKVEVRPSIVIEKVISDLIPFADLKQVQLHLIVEPEVPEIIYSDRTRLEQLLFNIVENAIKFTNTTESKSGQVVVTVSVPREFGNKATIRFNIIDNGVGIFRDKIKDLFTPFSQAESSTKRRFGGMGMGLAISKSIVDAMNGHIEVESLPHRGTTFTINISFEVSSSSSRLPQNTLLRDLSALVLVDSAETRLSIANYLSAMNVKGTIIQSENDAIQFLSSDQEMPLGLLIVALKKLSLENSIELVKNIRKSTSNNNLPALIVDLNRREDIEQVGPRLMVMDTLPLLHTKFQTALLQALTSSDKQTSQDKTQPDPKNNSPAETRPKQNSPFSGKKILVAEDNATNREVITAQLAELGADACVVEDGVAAFAKLTREPFDLLLTDCHMPGMDGYDLSRSVRKFEQENNKAHLPIVAVTASTMPGEVELCINSGMDDFLSKPVTIATLNTILQRWLPFETLPVESIDKPPISSDVASKSATIISKSALVERDMLANVVGDNPKIQQRILRKFIDSAQLVVENIIQAHQAGDFEKLGGLAHQLKSSSKSVGAVSLSALSEELEIAGKESDADSVNKKIPELQPIFSGVLDYIENTWLPEFTD